VKRQSVAKKCLAFSGLFEAELLLELMLRFWEHPLAADRDFRNELLEGTAEALRSSIAGQQLIAEIPPAHMNFVAAVWYVEWSAASDETGDAQTKRRVWLDKVRRAVPSCFCAPDDLS
jgi:hypothetical protein